MKEILRPEPLTNSEQTLYPGVRRDLFMAENQGEIPKVPPKVPPQFLPGEIASPEQRWFQEQEALGRIIPQGIMEEAEARVRAKREEYKGVEAYGQLGVEQRTPIFEGLELPTLSEERRRVMSEENRKIFDAKLKDLQSDIEAIEYANRRGLLNPEEEFNRLNREIASMSGVAPDLAMQYQEFTDRLAAKAREGMTARALEANERYKMQMGEDRLLADDIEKDEAEWGKRNALKNAIEVLTPDLRPIDQSLLKLIAEDGEAAEKFVDKIISRPFASPEADYQLSFYAEINIQSFFTEVRKLDRKRYDKYVRQKETALRFHQMNKTIISESGNVQGFTGMTRLFTPYHLESATRLDGVERVRQLFEIAFGRLYAKTNILTTKNFDEEILEWVDKQFRKEVSEGLVKSSSYSDASGNPRSLEPWETERAIAMGRNIHSSFYRFSELITWSNVPGEWEEWLKSIPTETVVRTLAGLKWLTSRFKIGRKNAGTVFTALLYDKIRKNDYKTGLEKIGKLNIAQDVLPARFFRGGGFDKGWRTYVAYLGSPRMKIEVPDPNQFPAEVQKGVEKFIAEHGSEVTFYEFLQNLSYTAQVMAGERARVLGVEIPEELRDWDPGKQSELIAKVLEPVLPQVNLSLGVLISYCGAGKELSGIRTNLWEKAADFLPLRTAYILSEAGVKDIGGYEAVRGTGDNLFSDEFESKLLKAQKLRFEAQKEKGSQRVELENYLSEAGLTDGEKQFVRELQRFGREKAEQLAKINFPHIPFLEDVPFKEADYIPTGPEVFPRRMGGDFGAFYEANSALNNIASELGLPYEEIVKNLQQIVKSISTPEGPDVAQDIVLPILQTYLEMAKQWGWTKVPFIKTIRGFMVKPTSVLQEYFGTNAASDDEGELMNKVRAAVEKQVIRGKKMPGEKEAQVDKLMGEVKATFRHVAFRELRSFLTIFSLLGSFAFFQKIFKEKD